VLVTFTTGGGLGSAVLTYQIDGGATSSPITVPGNGSYDAGSGIVLTFLGSFGATDTFRASTSLGVRTIYVSGVPQTFRGTIGTGPVNPVAQPYQPAAWFDPVSKTWSPL
jgi:hypothetical protein